METSRELSTCSTILLTYKKRKRVVNKVKDGHKYPNISHNYHDENNDELEIHQGKSKRRT